MTLDSGIWWTKWSERSERCVTTCPNGGATGASRRSAARSERSCCDAAGPELDAIEDFDAVQMRTRRAAGYRSRTA